MSAFFRALALVPRALKKLASETITIRRGPLSATIQATPTAPLSSLVDDEGQIADQVRNCDWFIDPGLYVLAGEITRPVDGDEFDWTKGDYTYTFKVTAREGLAVWSWTDSAHVLMRVRVLLTDDGDE
jgi:glyoxylate utilization-related uncharacterized protein